jgi:hypothetical protein
MKMNASFESQIALHIRQCELEAIKCGTLKNFSTSHLPSIVLNILYLESKFKFLSRRMGGLGREGCSDFFGGRGGFGGGFYFYFPELVGSRLQIIAFGCWRFRGHLDLF